MTILVNFRYFDITSLMTSQLRHTWSVGTLFGMIAIPWYHFYECEVLNKNFQRVKVTPLVRYVVKNALVGRGLIFSYTATPNNDVAFQNHLT